MPRVKRSASSPLSDVSDNDVPKKTAKTPTSAKASPRVRRAVGSVKKEQAEDDEEKPGIKEANTPKTPASPKKRVKKEQDDDDIPYTPKSASKTDIRGGTGRRTRKSAPASYLDEEESKNDIIATPKKTTTKSTPATASPSKSTLAKKLKQLEAYLQTPFPDHAAPTPQQCQDVQAGLAAIHGLPKRPEKLIDIPGAAAGCGAVPDVLDALVRTILSQNTTSKSR